MKFQELFFKDKYEIDDDATDIIVFNEYDCDIEVENVETYQICQCFCLQQ